MKSMRRYLKRRLRETVEAACERIMYEVRADSDDISMAVIVEAFPSGVKPAARVAAARQEIVSFRASITARGIMSGSFTKRRRALEEGGDIEYIAFSVGICLAGV